jgi:branched-chain amino acid aminotransferase
VAGRGPICSRPRDRCASVGAVAEAISASIDGELKRPAEATISVLDDGLLRGDGVFEAIKLYSGRPFRLREHLERLDRSARAIALAYDPTALEAEVGPIAATAAGRDAMLRIVLTRGGRRVLLVEELPPWPPSVRIALVTLSPSEILTGVKSVSYAANMHATRIAQERGADEAVYVDREGTVLEAPTSSVFWAGADGVLRTPGLETGILDSITRRVVIDGTEVVEGRYPDEQLAGAREAFLASTTREIQPISSVDGRELEQPAGSEATERARGALGAAIEAERDGQ